MIDGWLLAAAEEAAVEETAATVIVLCNYCLMLFSIWFLRWDAVTNFTWISSLYVPTSRG